MSRTINNFLRNLSAALNEKDVENAWRAFIQDVYPDGTFSRKIKA
jgi:hypothetical protein